MSKLSCPNCGKGLHTPAGAAFHRSWCDAKHLPTGATIAAPSPVPTAAECPGCGWDAWTAANPNAPHIHRADMDGSRNGCCAHTCTVATIAEPDVTPEPTPDRLGRKLTVKAAPVANHQGARTAKMPAIRTGKHSRCVAHVPMVRTAPGLAFACFDTAPDHEAIALRQSFTTEIDAAWNAHHAAYLARTAPEFPPVAPDYRFATGKHGTGAVHVDTLSSVGHYSEPLRPAAIGIHGMRDAELSPGVVREGRARNKRAA